MTHNDLSFGTAPLDPYVDVPTVGELAANGRTDSPESVDPDRGLTWRPIDLGPVLRGEVKRPEPTVGLCRSDGLRLLYPGLEHAVIGETECGKTWLCLACVVAELDAGGYVVYVHWEEADPVGTVERLQALDVPNEVILERFRFVAPNEPVTPEWWDPLLDPAPSLVVHDGVNEAMAAHGMEVNGTDGVAAFRRRLIKPCTAVGAAVLSADHVIKNREQRGRYAMGSIHKGNGLTGSLLLMENSEPFGRGRHGCSHVFITKDRPGHLRRHGKPSKTPGKTFIGSLIVDDERVGKDFLDLAFVEPQVDTSTTPKLSQHDEDDEHVLSVVAELQAVKIVPTLSKIRAKSDVRGTRVDEALERLVIDGKLSEREGTRRARVFSTLSRVGDES